MRGTELVGTDIRYNSGYPPPREAAITTLPHGTPALVMLDAEKNLAFEVLAGGPDNPFFRLVDKEGNTVFEAPEREVYWGR